jgi:hypothetical protein
MNRTCSTLSESSSFPGHLLYNQSSESTFILSMGLRHASLKQMWFLHTYITEVIQTVHTLSRNFYPIFPSKTKAERKVHLTMNNAHAEEVIQLPSIQKDSYHFTGIDNDRRVYDNVRWSCGTENVPGNAVAHYLGAKHSTHLLSSNLLLWDPFCNLQTTANSQFLMSISCSAPQN